MGTEEKQYVMTFDYHTHTTFSHGKGSIEDNVKAARERGLKGIAITDHGPGHLTYGIKKESVPVMRKEVIRLREKYPDIDIFLGVEANIVNKDNYLDVSLLESKDYDFIIAGYHYGVLKGYCVSNYILEHGPFQAFEKGQKIKNTEMTLKALQNNNIKILTHPGDKGPVDMAEIARVCAETDTLMEISTWHTHLTIQEIKIAAKYDVKFIISSDAHVPGRVGTFQEGIERAVLAGLDLSRIVNIKEADTDI